MRIAGRETLARTFLILIVGHLPRLFGDCCSDYFSLCEDGNVPDFVHHNGEVDCFPWLQNPEDDREEDAKEEGVTFFIPKYEVFL